MPLTFAHPAAILPFSRSSKYINFLALVLGSMAPDFEYFLRGKPYGQIGHTFMGFLFLNLPIVIIVYLIYRTYIHNILFNHLPSFLQDTYSEKPRSTNLLKVTVFLYSALFGMLTHVVWDSFTHLNGVMLNYPPLIQSCDLIEVGDSWEQSVLDGDGIHHKQRFLLFTKLTPQFLRFLSVLGDRF